MKYIDLSLPSPVENLACEEALLDLCEEGFGGQILRFWESHEPFVVVGYGNSAATEANLEACRADGVPVLRRLSGGGTVLQGPGCLNYSLVLPIQESGPLASITGANDFIMGKQRAALQALVKSEIRIEGCTDLAVGGLKFSGNAQRRKKKFLIFHGTILLNADISLIEKYLRMPSKEPDYRAGRTHGSFLTNLNLEAAEVKEAIRKEWSAVEPLTDVPLEKIRELSVKKYSSDDWNLRM